jgi:hypothetical protein
MDICLYLSADTALMHTVEATYKMEMRSVISYVEIICEMRALKFTSFPHAIFSSDILEQTLQGIYLPLRMA